MSKLNKKNKKSKKNNRKNYKIESLEPRLLMDASVNDWNDELNALNVGAYTIDSNSSKIDGLLVVDTNDMDKEPERLSLADVVNDQKVDFQQEWKDVKVHVKDCVNKVHDDAMNPYDDEVTRCNAVYVAAKTAYENANPGDEAKLKKKMDDAKKDYDDACAARQNAINTYKVDVDDLVQKLNSENKTHKKEWLFSIDSSTPNNHKLKVQIKKGVSLTPLSGNKEIIADIVEQTHIGVVFDEFDINTDASVGEYKNRVITAESMALSADEVRDLRTDDEILTGKDRDVVVGGEGGDIIHTGDGDDVAIGDNARLMVENNNPIGVFLPDVEVVLEDHQYFDAEKEAYLDHDNVDEQRMMQKFNDGKVVGIELLESENGRRDVIDVGAGENLSFEQNASDAPLYTGSQQGQSGEGEQGGNGNENQNSENGSENGNESGNGNENQGGETTVTTVESYLMETPLHLTAGETVKVVFHEYFRDSNYVPNLKLIFNGSEGQFAAIEVDLDTASGPLHYDIPSTWWYAVDVPDQPNGENGCFVVYFKAEEDTVITVSVAQ